MTEQSTASEQGTARAEIWYTRCGGATASTVAIQQNFLQAEFVDDVPLHSLQESTDPTIRASHFDHSIQSLFREGGNIPPIWARARGADTVVIGISWVDEFQSIVVRADSNIQSLADLRGRKLAVPLYEGSAIDFQRGANFHGLANGLGIAGLGREDVTFIDVPIQQGVRSAGGSGSAELEALFDGRAEAVFLRQSSGLRLFREHSEKLRELVRLTDEADPLRRINNGTPRPVTVHRAFLEQNRPLVVRYLGALLRAAEWTEANPAEGLEALAREDGRSDNAIIAATFPRYATSLRPRLTQEYIDGLTAQKDFLLAWGFLDGDFSIAEWVDHGPLEEAERLHAGTVAEAAE